MKTLTTLIFTLLLTPILTVQAVESDNYSSNPRAGVDYYLKTFGQIDPSSLEDVYEVFDRVLSVADKNNLYWPQLIVVNDTKQISAFVLSDGNIFISRRALEVIRDGASTDIFQARLAFVIGHELAHLANNDFWDEQVSRALLDFSSAKGLGPMINTSQGQINKELKADDQGFLYAALAGFHVDDLLHSNAQGSDFFTFWVEKVDSEESKSHPPAEQRAEILRTRLSEKLHAIDFYQYGIRLIHFDRFEEAIVLLKKFQQYYPGRELFNSLGFAYLKNAMSQLPASYSFYYWLPTVSDTQTRLSSLGSRSLEKQGRGMGENVAYTPQIREQLIQAIRYFRLAIEKDNHYLPAYTNLAIAQFLLEKGAHNNGLQLKNPQVFTQSLAVIEDALHRNPGDPTLILLKAFVLNEAGEQLLVQEAIQSLIDKRDVDLSQLYNLARLMEGTNESQKRWQQVLTALAELPYPIQQLLCQEKHQEILALHDQAAYQSICINRTFPRFTQTNFPWDLPIGLSRDLIEYPLTEAEIKEKYWQEKPLGAAKVLRNSQASALAIDDITTLLVIENANLGNIDDLIRCCGQPRMLDSLTNGKLWHYGPWAVVVENNKISEVWVNSY